MPETPKKPPATLPADFDFGSAPETLPADFFDRPDQANSKPSLMQRAGSIVKEDAGMAKDSLAGIGASAWQPVVGAYELAGKAQNAVNRGAASLVGLPPPPPVAGASNYFRGLTKPPETIPGKVGDFAGTAAQFMAPGAEVGKAVEVAQA